MYNLNDHVHLKISLFCFNSIFTNPTTNAHKQISPFKYVASRTSALTRQTQGRGEPFSYPPLYIERAHRERRRRTGYPLSLGGASKVVLLGGCES